MTHLDPDGLLDSETRYVFFTGKGGVGKTSLSCANAIALADRGKRVLLVSTDPASNLDEVLEAELGSQPTPVRGVPGLSALNIDPEEAARQYRERMVAPYRGVLPEAAVASIEEQLSGACTTEIAAFDEFSKLLGDEAATTGYDHVIFDTAPTGHTLRLLQLPAAWTGFLETNNSGTSCLGPLAGLQAQRALYAAAVECLSDPARTALMLVSRPEPAALTEAERTRGELSALGVTNVVLALNGVFRATDPTDVVARAMEDRGRLALSEMPPGLETLPRIELPLLPFALVGVEALRAMLSSRAATGGDDLPPPDPPGVDLPPSLAGMIGQIAARGRGVVMTMGKGGVGKTTIASAIAVALARSGHAVHLTTTDPAAHVDASLAQSVSGLRVSRIDPGAETRAYREEVMAAAGSDLDEQGRSLLEEDLRSPCTEEIAVFRAFAREVDEAQDGFVVMDTAPTGHALLLLDATEAYHRQVLQTQSDLPEAVRQLLPRLRDPEYTSVLIVTLPEATPVHEAARLQKDLVRAQITPYAWVINQSLTPLSLTDPVLRSKRDSELRYIREVEGEHASRVSLVPWMPEGRSGQPDLQPLIEGSSAHQGVEPTYGRRHTMQPGDSGEKEPRTGDGEQWALVTMPLSYPCGPDSTCCGSLGQSEEQIAEVTAAVQTELGVGLQVVYANERGQMRGRRNAAAVLRTFGFYALPILTKGDEVVAVGAAERDQVLDAMRGRLQEAHA